jgi:hypothetical protein
MRPTRTIALTLRAAGMVDLDRSDPAIALLEVAAPVAAVLVSEIRLVADLKRQDSDVYALQKHDHHLTYLAHTLWDSADCPGVLDELAEETYAGHTLLDAHAAAALQAHRCEAVGPSREIRHDEVVWHAFPCHRSDELTTAALSRAYLEALHRELQCCAVCGAPLDEQAIAHQLGGSAAVAAWTCPRPDGCVRVYGRLLARYSDPELVRGALRGLGLGDPSAPQHKE